MTTDREQMNYALQLLDEAKDLAFGEPPSLELTVRIMRLVKTARETLKETKADTQRSLSQRIATAVKRQRAGRAAATILSTCKHTRNDYMHTVFVESGSKWIIWNYNNQTQELSHGRFIADYDRARAIYNDRIDRY